MALVQSARRVRALKFFGVFSWTIFASSNLGFGQICSKYALVTERGVRSRESHGPPASGPVRNHIVNHGVMIGRGGRGDFLT